MKIFVGIDVSKGTLDVCLEVPGAKKPIYFQVPNTQHGFNSLLNRCKKHSESAELHFCMESTGGYEFDVACFLVSKGELVSVLNPAWVKYFIMGNGWTTKTDKSDARAIAAYGSKNDPRIWVLADPIRREICQLMRHRMSLGNEMRRVQNWLEHAHQKSKFQVSQQRALASVLEMQITATDREVKRLVESSEELKSQIDALTRIKGIGLLLALTLLSEMAHIDDYASAEQFAAHAGLAPRLNISGTHQGKTRITKAGNARVRSMAWMPAQTAMRSNVHVAALAQRLHAKGLGHKQIRVACMRKLLMLAYGVLKALSQGKVPFYVSPDETEKPKPARRVARVGVSILRARAAQTEDPNIDPLENRHLGWRSKAALKRKLQQKQEKTA